MEKPQPPKTGRGRPQIPKRAYAPPLLEMRSLRCGWSRVQMNDPCTCSATLRGKHTDTEIDICTSKGLMENGEGPFFALCENSNQAVPVLLWPLPGSPRRHGGWVRNLSLRDDEKNAESSRSQTRAEYAVGRRGSLRAGRDRVIIILERFLAQVCQGQGAIKVRAHDTEWRNER